MQIISEANKTVLKILKRFHKQASCIRLMHYCVEERIGDGILLFNLLTRELILLTESEYQNLLSNKYLLENWFVVPEDVNEKEYVNLVRWIFSNKTTKPNSITTYTIFTTTDCNARCFYCFELGRSRIPMSHETALKTAQYIKDHYVGELVWLEWFGGEPLLNHQVIDTICNVLNREGVKFASTMTTNGYLFDAELVQNAISKWNLKKVQITLDGTEEIYNRIKAFIHREGSAYRRVLENIHYLLDASINVSVRLNMDLHNAENLLHLIDELKKEFVGKTGLSVAAHHIVKMDKPFAEIYTEEEWDIRHDAMRQLKERIARNGLGSTRGINKQPKLHRCMADSGRSVTILPTGDIGLCKTMSENEFVGHVETQDVDIEILTRWKESAPESPECATCFYYPDCFRLKKCDIDRICFHHLRMSHLENIKKSMRDEYEQWKSTK